MQITYDPEVDILNLRLRDDKVVDSEYLEDENVVIDYNENNEVVALEIMDWSKRNSLSLPLVGILFKRSA